VRISKNGLNLRKNMYSSFYLLVDSSPAYRVEIKAVTQEKRKYGSKEERVQATFHKE
jgi:hypothetical protein